MEIANGAHGIGERARRLGGEHDERFFHVGTGGGRLGEERRSPLHGATQELPALRVGGHEVPRVLHPEGDVASLVDPGPPNDVRRHRIRCETLDEGKVLEEGPLAQHAQEERGLREVLLFEQRHQRALRERRRVPEPTTACQRAFREGLDVPSLVRHLRREEHHHLGEMRVDPRDEPRGHVQRRVLVLGEVRHDLADGPLEMLGERGEVVPRDVGGRVPLLCGGLVVEGGDARGPDPVALRLGVGERR